MENTEHIIVVDDDRDIRELLAEYLQDAGYRVSVAANGQTLRNLLEQQIKPDLVILDLMMPGEDGLSITRWLTRDYAYPIIMLTARGEPVDRIIGLEMGVDDYIPKPFEPRELLARIRSVLRRTHALPPNLREQPEAGTVYRFAQWIFDAQARHLTTQDGVETPLTSAEYRMLEAFLCHPQRVLNRDQLMEITRGREAEQFDRAIDLQVSRLRQKLLDDPRQPQLIKTIRGEGYILVVPVTKGSQ